MRRLLACGGLIFFIMTALGCNRYTGVKQPTETPVKIVEKESYIKIMATNKLLYHMIKDIVKDRHFVDYMLKTEEDQMSFQYTEDSINNIGKKDLFIYMGASYEPWIPTFITKVEKSKVGIVNISRGVRLINLSKARKYTTMDKTEVEYKENPYYWLNLDDYKTALSNVKNAIQEKDPKNRDVYEANFTEAIKNIDSYSKDLKALEEGLKKYTFVAVEDNVDYFTKYMNIKTIKLDELDKDEKNSAQLLNKLGTTKDLVLLYDKEEAIKPYSAIISKYNIRTVNIVTYRFDMSINDILKHNLEVTSSLVNTNKTN